MSEILKKLSEEQLKPASVTEGPVLVTAGAGSGKTRLLTHRIAHLVEDKGIEKGSILAITFTNKAANEMKERLGSLIGGEGDMWICTFHAMCSRILRKFASYVGLDSNFSIYGDSEKQRLLKHILTQDAEFIALEKNKLKVDTVAYHISNAKNELYSPDEYMALLGKDKNAGIIIRAFKNYQKELLIANAVDFDDMLVKVYELFKNEPTILEYFQNKFLYIHVDEFQDTNVVQYKLVELLSKKHKNIFVVGDEDQCIYSWRGAKFSNVQKFIDDNREDIKIFKLEQNYRSTNKILSIANKIIKHNTNRLDKQLWTDNEGGKEVDYFVTYSDLDEAELIAQKIKKLVVDDGYKYSDFAVLMRINALSRVLEEKFLNYQIPYEVYGGFKFYERKEVKDVLAYLKIVSNPKDNDSLVRVLSFPKKGIGEATITKLLEASTTYGMSAYEIAKAGIGIEPAVLKKIYPVVLNLDEFIQKKTETRMSKLLSELIDKFDIKNAFSKSVEEDISKLMNIETLEKSVLDFETDNEEGTLEDYLQSITLSRDVDSLDEDGNYVSLMTIHSAKGLEFKVVFVIGLVEGVLPLSRAIYSLDDNELEEERRLMYVATTRAKEELFLSRPSSKFNFESKRTEGTSPSRFLKEGGLVKEKTQERSASSWDSEYSQVDGYQGYKSSYNGNSSYSNYSNKLASFYEKEEDDSISETSPVSVDTLANYKKYQVGTRVHHKSFGDGVVTIGVTDPKSAFITIKFDTVGSKTLSLKFAPLTIIGS